MVAFVLIVAALPKLEAKRVYMIGNSITDSVHYSQFQQLAQSRAHTHIWGRHILLGSPLNYIWDNADYGLIEEPFRVFGNAFANYDWDAITLQTYDSDIVTDTEYAQRFIDLARERPYTAENGEFFIFARWPRKDRGPYLTYWPSSTNGSVPQSENAAYFELLVQNLKTEYPDVSIRMIPVGHVFYELEQRMRDGLIPNYTDVYSDFYSDGGHATDDGAYVCALTFFATIYKEDPRGLPLAGFNLKDPNAAAIFQEVVWEVVTTTPLSGVTSDGGFTITNSHLPRGSVNRGYEVPMRALFGAEPYTWSVVEGSLPPGITLSANGLFSGTPTSAGDYPLTIQAVDDDGETDSLETTFHVVVNTVPEIQTPSALPAGNQGTPYSLKFDANLGDPPLIWKLTSGNLPLGVRLDSDGRFYGTPGKTGAYNFTVEVSDDDFPADTDTAEFSLTINGPESNTLSVPRILQLVNVDGDLGESFWSLGYTASDAAEGSPTNDVRFGFAWDIDYLYIGVTVDDTTPNSGRLPLDENDVLQILLDANHDRETSYNVDDRLLTVDRQGALEEIFARGDGILTGVQSSAAGYTLEMAVPWANLQRTPYPGMGVGFDLVNRDDPDGDGVQHVLTWNGSDHNEPIPQTFGNLLLSGNVAGTPGGDVLIAYEPFGGPVRPLHNTGVPLGWHDVWIVQNGNTYGYAVEELNLPSYGDHRTSGELMTQGLRGSGGGEYLGIGRRFDVNTAFSNYSSNGDLGKDGQTLWVSWMARLDTGDAPSTVALSTGNFEWLDNEQRIRVRAFENQWRLKVEGLDEVNTGISTMPGETFFFAMRIDFAATSTVRLYINPTSLETVPTTATTTVQTTSNIGFRRLYWFPGASKGNATLDEIRVGTSYSAVTPIQPYPPIIDIAPTSVSTEPGQAVTFSVESFSRSQQSYQWFHETLPIPGATSTTLQLDSVSEEDLGDYSVRVRNASGSVTSTLATLSFGPEPYTGLNDWLEGISWSNPEDGMASADPDADGLENRWEYFLNTNPLASDNQGLSAEMSLTGTGDWMAAFSPLRRDETFPVELEVSSDLVQWEPLPESATLNIDVAPEDSNFDRWEVTIPAPSGASGALFMRFRLPNE